MNTKAKINLDEGTVELEGEENFVRHYLDIFSKRLEEKKITTATKPKNLNTETPNDFHTKKEKTIEKKISTKKRKTKSPHIEIVTFDDLNENGPKSLEEFMDEKKPETSAKYRIVVIGYYITQILGLEFFTEGNIEYAYKKLKLNKRPAHLRQVIINVKNEDFWFEEGQEKGQWMLTREATIFVEENLPKTTES